MSGWIVLRKGIPMKILNIQIIYTHVIPLFSLNEKKIVNKYSTVALIAVVAHSILT